MKNKIIILLKFCLAFGIIYFLVNSGKLDFKLLKTALTDHTLNCVIAYILMFFMVLLGAFRWHSFLKAENTYQGSYWNSIKLTYLGLFFNPLLPGAVTGDLIKMYYTYKLNNQIKKGHLISTVFLDRAFGVMSLLILFLFSYLVGKSVNHEIFNNTKFLALATFNLLILLALIVLFVFIFIRDDYKQKLNKIISKFPLIGNFWIKLNTGFDHYSGKWKLLIKGLFISLACQLLNTTAFYFIASPFFEVSISFTDVLLILPAGIIVSAIPITPMGIGVGHAFFIFIFNFFGEPNGANLFNLYLLIISLTDMTGIFSYLFGLKKIKIDSLDEIKEKFA